MSLTDKELVNNALASPEAFGAIVVRFEHRLDAYLQRIIYATKEDREDLLQEIFLSAYRYLHSFNSDYSLSTWLYTIAHNKAMSFLRKNRRRFAIEQQNKEGEENEVEMIASDLDIEEQVSRLLHLEKVKKEMESLTITEREVLVLRYCEEKDYIEIASILKMPEGTIASLIHRAKYKLKKRLLHE